ncbi:phosphate acyltransferase PlsX [Spirulina major CS-329]|uniref:phosphate acyltransferase PlsX n=1 Tax=Spirulina TaxID=1154 RepID=UPI002330ACB2|nr:MULTISPECIES: phosphate acyltransferase PlsX [Spirulina]MDB9496213.1 phosphate acyltransferase PlsX [Spirulina subsalsa CS-330]MDB9504259.1 phosphate acyltransferase PlsX [Spirulina major CS-329]
MKSSTRERIAVDAMGGDHAPDEIVAGAVRAAEELDAEILLVGDPEKIQACLTAHGGSDRIEIVAAEDVISMHDEATGVRRKPKASINVAMDLVKQDRADAVFSAGHSGAVMAAALLRLGRIKGIDRPAIGAIFPTLLPGKSAIILDVGANVDSRPKYLEQFGLMGSVYSQCALGVENPKIGLLNIGEEPSKGNELALRAHELLAANTAINFVGNAEGRDVLSGQFDVIVCDGFVGNVLLKFAEAIGGVLIQTLKEELPYGIRGQIGSAILRPNLRRVGQRIDHAEHGGGLLLGVNGVCIIGHGSSEAPSVFNAIRLAKEAIRNQVLARIHDYYSQRLEQVASSEPPSS